MARVKKGYGISDISSSEGKLRRYTLLCKIIRSEKKLTRKKLESLAEEKIGPPFKNKTVLQRHLTILEKMGLIERFEDLYTLSSDGKALCELTPDYQNITHLSFEEKAVYLKALFTSSLRYQLIEFLEVVQLHSDKDRREIISNYFSTELARSLWSEITIEKNLKRLNETGKIPTFFENKFRCMEMWLEDVGLIKKEKNKILLNPFVNKFLEKIKNESLIKSKIFEIMGTVLINNGVVFSYSMHRGEFLIKFKEAYQLFKSESNISDIRAIMAYVCVSLLKSGIILEEDSFYETIKVLWSEGLVKSVMLGRDGKPAHVLLSESI
ncbi:MAG: hypothetical protein QW090_04815 [Candidatus Bathyarchaeia archaeon]